jgi:drug/metabolite transporter (DMT)-like permease
LIFMNRQEVKGLWLGLAGVAIFALTLPMTRLAVGTPQAPQMSGVFIAMGRAVVAAGLSAAFLLATRASWWGFGYVAVFSMWIGFFAWYRGLALGGTVRVSQVQLVQPFLGMLFAVPLLGEKLDALTIGFALAVIAAVFIGRRMPVRPAADATLCWRTP